MLPVYYKHKNNTLYNTYYIIQDTFNINFIFHFFYIIICVTSMLYLQICNIYLRNYECDYLHNMKIILIAFSFLII